MSPMPHLTCPPTRQALQLWSVVQKAKRPHYAVVTQALKQDGGERAGLLTLRTGGR
jgi:hypothetical protein